MVRHAVVIGELRFGLDCLPVQACRTLYNSGVLLEGHPLYGKSWVVMSGHFLPQWIDRARPLAGALLVGVPVYAVVMLYYGGSPQTTDVGYAPVQPVPYSHALHVGRLGLDCRYCHTNVETAPHAAIPSTEICMNCHARVATDSKKLALVRQSHDSGKPIPWVRVHDLPDYVYFDHSAHVTRGVGCESCHGRIDKMDVVEQVKTLSMGWCLECHRNPEPHLRPLDAITRMGWTPEEDAKLLGHPPQWIVRPSTDCSTCHR